MLALKSPGAACVPRRRWSLPTRGLDLVPSIFIATTNCPASSRSSPDKAGQERSAPLRITPFVSRAVERRMHRRTPGKAIGNLGDLTS